LLINTPTGYAPMARHGLGEPADLMSVLLRIVGSECHDDCAAATALRDSGYQARFTGLLNATRAPDVSEPHPCRTRTNKGQGPRPQWSEAHVNLEKSKLHSDTGPVAPFPGLRSMRAGAKLRGCRKGFHAWAFPLPDERLWAGHERRRCGRRFACSVRLISRGLCSRGHSVSCVATEG
jgi:hypothetical protein